MKDILFHPSEALDVKNPGDILSPAALADLKTLQAKGLYPQGHQFFVRGQSPEGIYILYEGRVRLCISCNGEKLTIGEGLPGDILGLSAVVLGKAHEETAHAALPCRAGFISGKDFMRFLDRHGEAAYWTVKLLSEKVTVAYDHLSSFHYLPGHRVTQ